MLLVRYCFGIRSERRLCQEVHLNLAYRWCCRLDLANRVPDHSTFSKTRHGRFRESELLRHLFETTVARCIEEGLVRGQRMAIEASLIEANANKQNSTPKNEWDAASIDPTDAPRADREYLDTLNDAAFGAASEVQPKFTSYVVQAQRLAYPTQPRSNLDSSPQLILASRPSRTPWRQGLSRAYIEDGHGYLRRMLVRGATSVTRRAPTTDTGQRLLTNRTVKA